MEPETPAKFREEPATFKNRSRTKFFFFSLFFISLFFALMLAYWQREQLMEHLGMTGIEQADERLINRISEIEQRLHKIESNFKTFEERRTDLPSPPLSSEDFGERLKTFESTLNHVQEKLQKEQRYRILDQLRAKLKSSEPFVTELEKALEIAQEHQALREVVTHLQELASVGVPSLALLTKELDSFEKVSAEASGKSQGSVWEETKKMLTGNIRIEKRGEGEPEEKKGADQDLHSFLQKDELKAAIEIARNLFVPDFLEDKKAAWLRHAETRRKALEAERLLSEILLNEF